MKITTSAEIFRPMAHHGPRAAAMHVHQWRIRLTVESTVEQAIHGENLKMAIDESIRDFASLDEMLGQDRATCEGFAAWLLEHHAGLKAVAAEVEIMGSGISARVEA